MHFPSINSYFDFSNLVNNRFVRDLSPMQKKVAAIGLAIICALTLGYYLFSSYLARKEIIQNPEEDTAIQQQFEKNIQEQSPSVKKSPLKRKESGTLNTGDKEIDSTQSSKENSPLKDKTLAGEVQEKAQKDLKKDKQTAQTATDSHQEIPDEQISDDSQTEEMLEEEETKASSIVPVKESLLATPYQAKLALVSRRGGTAGPHFDKVLESKVINKWKLADGSNLPIQADTILLEFMLFNATDECVPLLSLTASKGITLILPALLFENKKEGEIIQLQYEGQLVNLELNQFTYSQGNTRNYPAITEEPEIFNFENIFDGIHLMVSEEVEEGKLGFEGSIFLDPSLSGGYDPLEGYTLSHGGKLYHVNQSQSLEEVDSKKFTDLTDFTSIPKAELAKHSNKFAVFPSEDEVLIRTEFCGMPEAAMDVVINEKFICIFGIPQDSSTHDFDFDFATLRIIPWKKYFKDFSLEEMQAAIQKSEIKLDKGILEIKVPTDKS